MLQFPGWAGPQGLAGPLSGPGLLNPQPLQPENPKPRPCLCHLATRAGLWEYRSPCCLLVGGDRPQQGGKGQATRIRKEGKPELCHAGGHGGEAPRTSCKGSSAIRATGALQGPMWGLLATLAARPLTPALPSPQVSGEALSWSPLPLEGPAASMANDAPLRGRAPDSHNQGPTVIPRPPS